MTFGVAAFYKFVAIDDCDALKARLEALGIAQSIFGTVLIAPEGVNGTIAAGAPRLAAFLQDLSLDQRFADIDIKWSTCSALPFRRLKIKVKPEIVTMGAPEAKPAERTGTKVSPQAWNTLLADPDIFLIDTRNSFEVAVGSFPAAINPQTKAFSDFPTFAHAQLDRLKHAKVAMFCTGGIRCEKASAYLLDLGVRDVFQLDGGILKYLEVIPPDQSLWQGECVVFDERISVDHGVRKGTLTLCPVCGNPVAARTCCLIGADA